VTEGGDAMASGGSVLERKEKRQFMDDYVPLRVVAFTSRILPSYVVRDPHFSYYTCFCIYRGLFISAGISCKGPTRT